MVFLSDFFFSFIEEYIRVCACTQLCSTLWDRMDCSPPGPSIREILQARIMECLTNKIIIYFKCGGKKSVHKKGESSIVLDSKKFTRGFRIAWLKEGSNKTKKEWKKALIDKIHWSGLPFPTPGELPDPGIKPVSVCLLYCRWVLHH